MRAAQGIVQREIILVAEIEGVDEVMPPFLAVIAHACSCQGIAEQAAISPLAGGEPGIFGGGAFVQQVVAAAHVDLLAAVQVDEGDIHRHTPVVLGLEAYVFILINQTVLCSEAE